MHTIALIGFLGGLITGISPCILPVLPVVFLSGVNSNRVSSSAARPYLVIAGLVVQLQRGHPGRLRAVVGAASAPGRDPVGRAGDVDPDRPRTDLPDGDAPAGTTVRPHPTA